MQIRSKITLIYIQSRPCLITLLILLVVIVQSCVKNESKAPMSFWEPPSWFPKVSYPEDNKFTLDRWELGKKLFYETRLSIDNSISCSSCHSPELSFSDNKALSPGVFNRPGVRNSSMLANIAYAPNLLREGGVPTLEMQVLVPIQEHNEFDHNILVIAEELSEDTNYILMALKAYESEVTPFVITRALANFQRTLISGNSRYDQYAYQGMIDRLSEEEIKGMNLFFSDEFKCSACHSGVLFTSFDFANNGLKEVYEDEGRFRLTHLETDRAVFKIPSLRNIEHTGPYLHDGSIESLEEIIDIYSEGGFSHQNKSELLNDPLNISNTEKQELIAFLKCLSDPTFLNNDRWQE